MSALHKEFLLEDLRRLNPNSGRNVFLAAFGKHPGWDDHVEDLGLETEGLIFAKTLLYVQGIGGQIDSGAWEKLEPSQQIPSFKHLFVWQRGTQFLAGRMWSSSDGKGRTRYPMIVCAHCTGVTLTWAFEQVLPCLQQIEEACLLTRSAADVRQILSRYRSELQHAINSLATDVSGPILSAAAMARFVSHPSLGPGQEGWFRVLYQMQSQTTAFAPGRFNLKGDLNSLRPQQIRVPPCGDSVAQSIALWNRFFLSQVDPAVPVLLTLPLEEPWLDATLGEPASHEFFCLRASPKAVPLASEVPYSLDDAFRAKARAYLDTLRLNDGSAKAQNPVVPGPWAPSKAESTKPRFFRWFGVIVALLGIVVQAAAF
jgi:hypothetical protein